MLRPIISGFAAFIVTGSAAAIAQDEGARPLGGGRMILRTDADNDGVVTKTEFVAEAGERFDRMDLNRDGRIDAAELQQLRQRMRGDRPPPPRG